MTMPIRLAILCTLQLTVSTIAFAQEPPVSDCDKYAASDIDPQRRGLPFDKINPVLAVPACEDAVRQFPNSMRLRFQLGRAYENANNFTAAIVQFRKAAEQNYALAQYDLGLMYANSVGVPRDDQQASAWFRKAADQDNAKAQFDLGLMYANGLGVPRDYQQAVAWFRKAADQRLVAAQISLGVMYAKGQGVPKDDQQAILWYRKAAEQGDKRAKAMLNELESS